jgi:hypothetical protein
MRQRIATSPGGAKEKALGLLPGDRKFQAFAMRAAIS